MSQTRHFSLITLLAAALAVFAGMPVQAQPAGVAEATASGMEQACQQEGDNLPAKRKIGWVQEVNLGKGRHAWIVSGEKLKCIRAAVCGTGGCQLRVVYEADGVQNTVLDQQARGWKLVRPAGSTPFLRLDMHGGGCGKAGSAECFQKLDLETGELSAAPR